MEVRHGAVWSQPPRPSRPHRAPPPAIARTRARRQRLPRDRRPGLRPLRPGRCPASHGYPLSYSWRGLCRKFDREGCESSLSAAGGFVANSIKQITHHRKVKNENQAIEGTWMAVNLVDLDRDQRCRDDYAEPLRPTFHQPKADPLS